MEKLPYMQAKEVVLQGIPICRGIAIGRIFYLKRNEFIVCEEIISRDQVEKEIERYRTALIKSQEDLKKLQSQLKKESALDSMLILEAQLQMLQDPLMTKDIEEEIRTTYRNAEFIFQKALVNFQKKFYALEDTFFKERFKDLKDLAGRVMSCLNQSACFSLKDLPPGFIVCAQELTASDAAEAHALPIEAFITQSGGITSHAVIVAKAKGIPYITNVDVDILKQHTIKYIIVDGRLGQVIINPTEETLSRYEQVRAEIQKQVKDLEDVISWPAQTFDGYSIRLCANLSMAHEADLVQVFGGEGIGLFRSEYIFLSKTEIPSEEEQFHIYSQLVQKMNKLPIVIRTFDLSGDKVSKIIAFEKNSFFGGRATRLLLQEKEIFRTQIRAILRANVHGNISLLFPMLSTLNELREAKRLVEEVQEELKMPHRIRLGSMIEVPSAALISDHFAEVCDFLSIGTNDLIQYSLAADRSYIHGCHELTDPSVIRLIRLITHEANKVNIPVSICGEMAADPRLTMLFIGLGVKELSVAPNRLLLIKDAVRRTSLVDAVYLVEEVLRLPTAEEVLDLLIKEYQKNFPHDLFYNISHQFGGIL